MFYGCIYNAFIEFMTLHVSYGGFEDSSTVERFVILITSLVFLRECFCIFLNAQLCLRSEFGPEPPTTAPAITRLHPLPKSRTLSLKGRGYCLMLLYDWSISTSIRSWRSGSLSNSDRAPEAQRLARRRRRECAPREEAPTVCSHRKKTRIFQLIHGEICFTRRPDTYPIRTAALTTTGDANICSSQRLDFTEGFRSSFVFGGARVPVSSSPWVPFRAFRWQLTLDPVSEGLFCLPPVRFTRCPCQRRAACTLTPARPRSFSSSGDDTATSR